MKSPGSATITNRSQQCGTKRKKKRRKINKPEDPLSCLAHLRAEDMLKPVVIQEKKFKLLNVSDLEEDQWMTLTFDTHLDGWIYQTFVSIVSEKSIVLTFSYARA